MDVAKTPEQEAFGRTVVEFFAENADRLSVRDWEQSALGYSQELWGKMADLGWLGIVFPKKYGGQDRSWLELVILLGVLGSNPCPTPYQTCVLQSGLALLHSGSERQKRKYLPKILDGSLRFSFCFTEPTASYEPWGLQFRGLGSEQKWVLNGTKLFIQYAGSADYYLVLGRTKDSDDDLEGLSLFLVDAKSDGIHVSSLNSISDDKQCEVAFHDVEIPKENLVGKLHGAWPVVNKVLDLTTIALCAEMAGGTRAALNYAIEYAKIRVQFGRPIGSFQAIQHYAADMVIEADAAELSVYEAAWKIDQGLAYQIEASSAKAICSEAYTAVTSKGHQIMGGIGIYKEMDMQLWFRRAKAMEQLMGDSEYHRQRLAQLMNF